MAPAELLRMRWLWPLPAVIAHAAVLAFSRRVWTETVVVYSKTGAPHVTTIGARDLVLVATLSAIFYGAPPALRALGVGGARGLVVDEAQIGCVIAVLRVATLGLLYVTAWQMLLR